jgi:hypothetical protein
MPRAKVKVIRVRQNYFHPHIPQLFGSQALDCGLGAYRNKRGSLETTMSSMAEAYPGKGGGIFF